MTRLELLSGETLESWAESQARSLDAVDILVDTVRDAAWDHGLPYEVTMALQAAGLLLAEARVTPRLLLEEVAYQRRVDARRGGGK